MELTMIEFIGLPDGEVEVRKVGETPFILDVSHREFITAMLDKLIATKPVAVDALYKRYEKSRHNTHYFEFLVVRGFIKCNFSPLDNKYDIDESGRFHTEFFLCPRTGECHECGLICNSPESTALSAREIEVLRLISQGFENTEIADQLYISVNTVHNHRNSILKKTGKNNTAELVRYWFESGLK